MTYFLILTVLTSVGVLLGSIFFLSLVLAPIVFQTLDAQAASRLLRALFPRYYRLGLICCGVALGPALALAANERSAAEIGCAAIIVFIAVVIAYSLRLVPRINSARNHGPKARFDTLHRRSVTLNGLNLAAAFGAFALAAGAAV